MCHYLAAAFLIMIPYNWADMCFFSNVNTVDRIEYYSHILNLHCSSQHDCTRTLYGGRFWCIERYTGPDTTKHLDGVYDGIR